MIWKMIKCTFLTKKKKKRKKDLHIKTNMTSVSNFNNYMLLTKLQVHDVYIAQLLV